MNGAGAVTMERAGRTVSERRSFSVTGGMCPRCGGMGCVNDIDLTQLFDDSKREINDFFYRAPIKVKVGDINMTYGG